MTSYYDDVRKFNKKFDLDCHGLSPMAKPRLLDKGTTIYRLKFLLEELSEFSHACNIDDMPGAADALVDLVYVALGTAHFMGLPFDELWAEVQRANMQKERATDPSQSKRGSALDVIKPNDWRPPDIAGVLRAAGWK